MTVAALLALSQAGKAPEAPKLSFGSLAGSQTITVDFRSRGCFHRDAYLLRFRPVPGRAACLVVDVTENDPRGPKRALGSLALDAEDVRRLDGLLKFYRERRKGESTTVTHVRFEWRDGREAKATEEYEDATMIADLPPAVCRELGLPVLDLLTVDSIVRTLRERRQIDP